MLNRRVIAITGDGKGKTTSAIGCATRAIGRGLSVRFYQFLKSMDARYGEHIFFDNITSLKLVPLGCGCRPDFKYTEKDIKTACDGWDRIKKECKDFRPDLIVLDEITYVTNWGWIDVQDIVNFIKENNSVSFVLTGRSMPKAILDIADTVSEITEIKHAYREGINAMEGFEF